MTAVPLREIRRHALIYAALTPFVVIAVFPVLWMAITAFKEDADLYRTDHVPFWFYLPPTLEHFRTLFSHTYFGTWLIKRIVDMNALRRRSARPWPASP